jgi:diguanylate cyclase (GGDEF)-like protein
MPGRVLTSSAERLLVGRLAGLLFLVGSLATIPVNGLFDPAVSDRAHWVTGLGVASGLLCLLIPWDLIRPGYFHLLPPIASLEVAVTMWGVEPHGSVYAWFLVFIVVFAAYVFESRRVVTVHVLTAVAMLAVPVVGRSEGPASNELGESLICVPVLLVAAMVVVHLRERLTAAVSSVAEEARSDALTGVGNYRLLEERLGYEMMRHRRNGRPLSLVVLDLDDFKSVNDTYGHPVGDQLLRQVASVLCATVREQDTVVRQGGDEFCVMVPEADGVEAAELVTRIKHALRAEVAAGGPISASAGFATFPGDATTPAMLLAEADREQRRDKAAAKASRRSLQAVR